MNLSAAFASSEASGPPSRRVLVIDDQVSILALLETALSLRGYAVETACGAYAGLLQFRTRHPDIVLVDREMSELDGSAVAAEIKRLDPNMPIVLLTGSQHAVRPMGEEGAIDAVVSKPFSSDSIQDGILTALHRRAA